ncbi:copper amine oxidase N-terminal domain-containing protein [Paenibacillus antri]|uniref:Copper amine oxidase N-terminal domain-containing protein n=1 Tax=Paenibacillus antri TaxID=2582848 RepID=A0A5R9G9R4_9BACL|nr:copper amine oxidase N-terminal domain-containing protein [Paenibacillus antri]TLS52481.1 copper amine oxidase N-terminal domain-containing protein [Paenibacillus antri]
MKRRSELVFIACLVCMFPFGGLVHAQEQDPIRVYIDGVELAFAQQPLVHEGTTMVPFRPIFENLGYNVHWNAAERVVLAERSAADVALRLNISIGTVNQVKYWLTEPPQLSNGTTYIPLRFVAEASGATVRWDNEQRSVYIERPDKLTEEEQIRIFLEKYFSSLSLNEYLRVALPANGVKVNRTEIVDIRNFPEDNAAEATYQIEVTAMNGQQLSTVVLEFKDRLTVDEGRSWSVDHSARVFKVIHEAEVPVTGDDLYMEQLMKQETPASLSEQSSIEEVVAFIIHRWEYGMDRTDVEEILKDLGASVIHAPDGLNSRVDFHAQDGYTYNSENGSRADITGLREGALQGQIWLEWNSNRKIERLDMYWTRTGDHKQPKTIFTYGFTLGGKWY